MGYLYKIARLILFLSLPIELLAQIQAPDSYTKAAPAVSVNKVACTQQVIGCNQFATAALRSRITPQTAITYPAPVGNSCVDGVTGTNWNCISRRTNQNWFYIEVPTSGNRTFTFTNSSGTDVDGILWGPLPNRDFTRICELTQAEPMACDYSVAASVEFPCRNHSDGCNGSASGSVYLQAGQIYVMCILNYSEQETNISISQPMTGGAVTYYMASQTGSSIQLTQPFRFGGGQTALNIGTSYGISGELTNQNTTAFTGNVVLRIGNQPPITLVSGITIPAGGNWNFNPTVHRFTPQTAQAGQNVVAELQLQTSSGGLQTVSPVGAAQNPTLLTIRTAVATLGTPQLIADKSLYMPGGTIKVVGSGFKPNESVVLRGSPDTAGVVATTIITTSDGALYAQLTIPVSCTQTALVVYGTESRNLLFRTGVLAVTQPAQQARLRLNRVYSLMGTNTPQSGNSLPRINVSAAYPLLLDLADKLISRPGVYPQANASRAYRYEVTFRDIFSTSTRLMRFAGTGLLSSSLEQIRAIPADSIRRLGGLLDRQFTGTIRITDLYDPSRFVESEMLEINVNTFPGFEVRNEWDKSFKADPARPVRPVGVAADGVARMYVVVKKTATSPAIQRVDIRLMDSDNNPTPAWRGKVMYATAQNNDTYEQEATGTTSMSATSLPTNTSSEHWFWYVAPDDFQSGFATYGQASERTITARITVTYGNGSIESADHYISVVRPPLMLVHGWNSGPDTWDNFTLSRRFGFGEGQQSLCKITRPVTMFPDVSYEENAKVLLGRSTNLLGSQSSSFHETVRRMRVLGYASNQVDYVAHSMGGVMARAAIERTAEYLELRPGDDYPKNYTRGWIHKLITINTPHNGSPWADVINGMAPLLPSSTIQKLQNLAGNDFKNFMVPAGGSLGLYRACDAVQNLQTNGSNFGKIFGVSRVPAHFISSDMAYGDNKFTLFEYRLQLAAASRYGNSPLLAAFGLGIIQPAIELSRSNILGRLTLDMIGESVRSLATPDVRKAPNILFSQFITANKQSLQSSWNAVNPGKGLFAVPEAVAALSGTMELYGQWNGKYTDLLYNGDLIVPLSSQRAGLPGQHGAVTTFAPGYNGGAEIDGIDFDLMHTDIVSLPATQNRVEFLLNQAVSSSYFTPEIPANTNAQKADVPDKSQQTGPFLVERFDPARIRIVTPGAGSTLATETILNARISLSDTIGLKRVTLLWGTNQQSETVQANSYDFAYPTSTEMLGRQKLWAEAIYQRGDSTIHLYDTLSVLIVAQGGLLAFRSMPNTAVLSVEERFLPTYELRYPNFTTRFIDLSKLTVTISNTATVSYDVRTGAIRGRQKGEAILYVDYEGLSDTLYVAVGGGGDPYPQQISTGALSRTLACAGTTLTVAFSTSGGAFESGNEFLVQLSDQTGDNFQTLPTSGTSSPLSTTLPADLLTGNGYRIRVVSINPPVLGMPSPQTLTVAGQLPTATLTGSQTITSGQTAGLTATLTGSNPRSLTLSNGQSFSGVVASPFAFTVAPASTTTYTLTQVANACGTGTVSGTAVVTVQNSSTCAAPTSLTETEMTPNSIRLNWLAVSGATSYTLQYRETGTTSWTTASPGVSATGWTITALLGKTYEWQIRMVCPGGQVSQWSALRTFTMTCPIPFGQTEVVSPNTVTLTWRFMSYNGVSLNYNLQWRVLGSNVWTTVPAISSSSYPLTSLVNGQVYEWQLQTVCPDGTTTPFTLPRSFTTGCYAPAPVSDQSRTATSTQITWQNLPGVSFSLRYRAVGSASWNTLTGLTGNLYSLTGLTNATTYEAQVQSVCSASQTSAFTTSYTFTTSCTPPSTGAGTVSTNSALLTWNNLGVGVRYNLVWRQIGSPTSFTVISLTTSSYSLTGLTNATTYEFQVQTICTDGSLSNYSDNRSFTTGCNAPAGFSSTLGATFINATWTDFGPGVRYNLQWRPVGATNWTTLSGLTTASYNLTGLSPLTAYEFMVQTICPDGSTSIYSTPRLVTTTPCQIPTNPTESNLQATSVRLNWGWYSNTSLWLQWRIVGAGTWNTVSGITAGIYNLTGLTPSTAYEWQVQTDCSPTVSSALTASRTFTTASCTSMYSVRTGNWNDPATWSCNRVPISSDVVKVSIGHTVTIPSGVSAVALTLQEYGRLVYGTGSRLRLGTP